MQAKRTKHDGGGGVSLPEDIVFEVLVRLPAKAVCRFRCVCKGWHALISDRAFVAAQRSRAADPHLVGVFLGPRCLPEVRVMDMDGNVVRAFEITRSTPPLPPQLPRRLDDLICADGIGLTRHGGIVIDPAAGRAFAAFGKTDPTPWATYTCSTTPGRASPSGDLKVLRLQLQGPFERDDDDGAGGGHIKLCEVATIMDGGSGGGAAAEPPLTWRRKPAPPLVITGWSWEHKAIVNGVVYFIHGPEIDGGIDDHGAAAPSMMNRIVAFDLESEEWKAEAINGPSLGHDQMEGGLWSSIALVELKGTLALVHEVIVNKYPYTTIWLCADPDKSVWVKEYTGIPMPKNQMGPVKSYLSC